MPMKVPFSIDRNSFESLTRQVENGFRRAILSGSCAAGTRLPSRAELSSALGVSELVVRTALGKLRKEGLVILRPRIGCVVQPQNTPNWRARVLLMMPFSEGAYYDSALARAFTDRMLEQRVLTMTVRQPPTRAGESAALDELSLLSADFVVLMERSPSVEKALAEKGMPFLALRDNARTDACPWFESVLRQCVATGVRRVALFHTTRGYAAERRAFAAVGIRAEDVALEEPKVSAGVTEAVERSGLEECARRLKRWKTLPDLILVPGDEYLASGVWTALADAGVRVPEDVRFASIYVRGHGPVLPKTLASIVHDPLSDAESVAAHVLARLDGAKRIPPFACGVRYVAGETFPEQ